MEKPGLYVHIPFCGSKCPYCSFYSLPSRRLIPSWLGALDKEAGLYEGLFGEFDTLYLGGGTPSILKTEEIARLMDLLTSHFPVAPGAEITLEANPGDLDREKIKGLRDLGINRINLGVQSFDDRILRFLGRRHTAGDAEAAFTALRRLGYEKIGMDLIYGIHGQSAEGWMETLDRALSWGPEHLSCYQLTVEPRTPLERSVRRGLFPPLKEEEERKLFLMTSRFLEKNGYLHYEVSNFAREDRYRSRHNCKYWSHVPYLGLGPSAHSFLGEIRWWNVRSVRRYCEALGRKEGALEGYEILTQEQLNLESVSLGLRTREGIPLRDLPATPELNRRILALEAQGLLKREEGRLAPTREGLLVADGLPLYLMD